MSVNSAVFSNLQSINPSAIIELFSLQLSSGLHYNSWEANKSYTVNNIDDISPVALLITILGRGNCPF